MDCSKAGNVMSHSAEVQKYNPGDDADPSNFDNVHCIPGQKKIWDQEKFKYVCENCGAYTTSKMIHQELTPCAPCEAGVFVSWN